MAKPNQNPKPRDLKPPLPSAMPGDDAPPRPPLWETLAMAGAFVLLWFWFAAHKAAQNSATNLSPWWTAALLLALGAMAFITMRRARRFKRALEESQQQMRRGPGAFPWMPPDRNGHN